MPIKNIDDIDIWFDEIRHGKIGIQRGNYELLYVYDADEDHFLTHTPKRLHVMPEHNTQGLKDLIASKSGFKTFGNTDEADAFLTNYYRGNFKIRDEVKEAIKKSTSKLSSELSKNFYSAFENDLKECL